MMLLDMYLSFLLLYFSGGSLYILSLVHIYIQSLDPQINTGVNHNMLYRTKKIGFPLLSRFFLCTPLTNHYWLFLTKLL
jgi:hypothetical protein